MANKTLENKLWGKLSCFNVNEDIGDFGDDGEKMWKSLHGEMVWFRLSDLEEMYENYLIERLAGLEDFEEEE